MTPVKGNGDKTEERAVASKSASAAPGKAAGFVDLLKTEKTQQRIQHMLETGKPLRN